MRTEKRKGFVGFVQRLGPGLITGASDDDPSGIGTYSQAGSQFGFGVLWTALFTFPFMVTVQDTCARIALKTGVGLGATLRRRSPGQSDRHHDVGVRATVPSKSPAPS